MAHFSSRCTPNRGNPRFVAKTILNFLVFGCWNSAIRHSGRTAAIVERDQHETAPRAQLPFAREQLLGKQFYFHRHGGLSYGSHPAPPTRPVLPDGLAYESPLVPNIQSRPWTGSSEKRK